MSLLGLLSFFPFPVPTQAEELPKSLEANVVVHVVKTRLKTLEDVQLDQLSSIPPSPLF